MMTRISSFYLVFLMLFFTQLIGTHFTYAQEPPLDRQELEEQYVEQLYREAVNLYKEGQYARAKVKFIQVKVRNSDYKATETFLNRIADHLTYQERQKVEQDQRVALQQRKAQEAAEKRTSQIERRLRSTKDGIEKTQKKQRQQQQRAILAEKKRIARARRILEKQKKQEEQAAQRQQQKEAKRLAIQQQQIKKTIEAKERQAELAALKAQQANEKLDSPAVASATSQEKIHHILQQRVKGLTKEKPVARERLEEKRARYQQDQTIAQTQGAYRDVLSSYKAKRYDYAWERLADLKTLLLSQQLPEPFRQQMSKKAAILESRVQQSEKKDQWLKDRSHLREEERQARLNEKARRKAQKQKGLARRPTHVQRGPIETYEDSTKIKEEAASKPKKGDFERIADSKASLDSSKATSPQTARIEASESFDPRQRQLQQALEQGIAELYQDGVELYLAGSLDLARQVFLEIDKLSSNYKHTRQYLQLIESQSRPQALEKLLPDYRSEAAKSKSVIVAETLDSFHKTDIKEERK